MTWATHSEDHYKAIAEILMSGSDTAVAIIGGSYLDDTLRRTLSERLRDDKDIRRKLLKPSGSLGNSGPKIDALYMLYAFERDVRNAMYGVCDIRNFFAHNLGASFDSDHKTVVGAFKNLTLHEGKKHYPHHIHGEKSDVEIEEITSRKTLFIVNLKLCLIALMNNRVSHHLWTTKRKTIKELRDQKRKWKSMDREGTHSLFIVPATSLQKSPAPKTPRAQN